MGGQSALRKRSGYGEASGQGPDAHRPDSGEHTLYLALDKIVAWEDGARPGEWLCFAVGAAIDPEEPVVALVERRRRAGRFTVREEDKGGAHHWIATCQVASASRDAVPPGRIVRDDAFEATPQGRLFMLLVRLANVGMACPSNAEIAERLGWSDREQVKYRLGQLVAGGRVRVAATGRLGGRIVTVIETGKRTGDPDKSPA